MIELRNIGALLAMLRAGDCTPSQIVDEVLEGIELTARPEAWAHLVDGKALRERARALEIAGERARRLPLFGIPFAIKDNIDAAGLPTAAGCPAFAYTPTADASVVASLFQAGAILVGKTHMDQFATGLVGTRSPYGPCRNAHVRDRIAGGSSSGSAVVVAEGLVSFALGTDTAGSGRVPAALAGVLGLKPTRGRVSTRGVVPACASLDCVSVFARSSRDAARVLEVLDVRDAADPFARMDAPRFRPGDEDTGASLREAMEAASSAVSAQVSDRPPVAGLRAVASPRPGSAAPLRVGVPDTEALAACDAEARTLFAEALAHLEVCGAHVAHIDWSPLREAASLLYTGPWLAERVAAFGDFLRENPAAVDSTVATIVRAGEGLDARETFEAMHRLQALRRRVEDLWKEIDLLAVPTVTRPWHIADVLADPLTASIEFGAFHNFVNLLDLAACAVPTGAWSCGVPFGITLSAPAWTEARLLGLASRIEARAAGDIPRLTPSRRVPLAVVGAHLRGMPLSHQLTDLGARFLATTRTSPDYRLFRLASTSPAKPGLCRVHGSGASIEVEVWSLAPEAFGRFVASVPRPLAIGRVTLEDGSEVSGFVCEPEALDGAEDISRFGGWRAATGAQAGAGAGTA